MPLRGIPETGYARVGVPWVMLPSYSDLNSYKTKNYLLSGIITRQDTFCKVFVLLVINRCKSDVTFFIGSG
jgi:hypothetical protein